LGHPVEMMNCRRGHAYKRINDIPC